MNPVQKHLSTYSNEKTRRGRKYHLNDFFNFINKDPETYFSNGTTDEQYLNDFKQYYHYCRNKFMYNSIRVKLSTIRVFLRDNGIDISDSTIKELKGRSRPSFDVTRDYVPTKKEMRQILSFADTKERALFLTAISSGMRIGEIIKLLPADINWENNPVKISIRGTISKNGYARITFISNEARDVLKAWLKIRDSYLETAVKRCDGNGIADKDPNDKRVFPVSYQVPYFWWRRLIKCAGFDEKDSVSGRYKVHIHCLRKFLRTNLPVGGMSVDAVETILGHNGYLTKEYRRIDENELAKQYIKAMFKVTISDTSDEITDDEKNIEEQVKQRLEERVSEIERNLTMKLMKEFRKLTEQQKKDFQPEVTPEELVRKVTE